VINDARFEEAGPFTVANGATGEAITGVTGTTVPINGTIVLARILITGGPGAAPTAYEFVVAVNGVDTIVESFTSAPSFTEHSVTTSHAVTAGNTLTARVRHAGGSPRSPDWTDVRIDVSVDVGPWAFDVTLPAGNYCGTRTLS
jgi:hypothetical protein